MKREADIATGKLEEEVKLDAVNKAKVPADKG